MVPFGVYLSWERTGACARHYGIDRWEDVRKRLDAIAANHVDTLWVTNMAEADLPRLITECNIFYTLAPEAPNAKTESLPPPDIAKKNDKIILAKEPTDLGPNALTNPDGTATPQLEEIGKAYQLLAPHKALIRRWKRTDRLVATVEAPIEEQCFIDPTTGKHYAVVVNDDLHRTRVAKIHLGAETTRLADIILNEEIELEEADFAGGGRLGHVTLAAGEGTILGIERKGEKGK